MDVVPSRCWCGVPVSRLPSVVLRSTEDARSYGRAGTSSAICISLLSIEALAGWTNCSIARDCPSPAHSTENRPPGTGVDRSRSTIEFASTTACRTMPAAGRLMVKASSRSLRVLSASVPKLIVSVLPSSRVMSRGSLAASRFCSDGGSRWISGVDGSSIATVDRSAIELKPNSARSPVPLAIGISSVPNNPAINSAEFVEADDGGR